MARSSEGNGGKSLAARESPYENTASHLKFEAFYGGERKGEKGSLRR